MRNKEIFKKFKVRTSYRKIQCSLKQSGGCQQLMLKMICGTVLGN